VIGGGGQENNKFTSLCETVIGDHEIAIAARIVRFLAGQSADNLRNREWQDRCLVHVR
jgi:hypothetical protein